jgi:hypothetical protein
VTPIVLVIVVLIAILLVLIVRINHAEHYAPQAYYRKKTAGAPVVFEFESLAPRPRKVLPGADGTPDEHAATLSTIRPRR